MKFTQVLLFSASVDKKTRTNTLCFKPIFIDINSNSGNTSQIPSTIKHISVISDRRERIETLRKIIKAVKPEKAIIFVNSKYDLEESLQKLEYHHYNVASIAGNKDNSAKKAAIENFRSGKIQLLIATDIAARGLQIDNIDTVINVNLPEDNKEYIHRCGRCGRNGNIIIHAVITSLKSGLTKWLVFFIYGGILNGWKNIHRTTKHQVQEKA